MHHGKTGAKPRAVHFGGGGGGTAAYRHPGGVGRVPAAGHAGVWVQPGAGDAGLCGAGGGLRCGLRDGRLIAGRPRPALCRALGYGAAGGGILCGFAGTGCQRGAVFAGVQPARGAGQCVFGPGGAGLRAKVVQGQKRLGHRRGRGGDGLVRRVFYAVCERCGRCLGHPRLLCGPGSRDAGNLWRGSADFARPARPGNVRKPPARVGLAPDGAYDPI